MRAVAYLRVSSLSQVDGHSLDAQERLFNELCKKKGWDPARIYREEGKSAHVEAISRRPEFKRLLDDASRDRFDVVVVHTLDRWSRNMKVTMESMSILAKHNVSLVSISENIDYTTPQGKLFTQMIGSFAEYFSGALSNHVSKGLDQRAHEGKHTGGIPFGYESCWSTGNKAEKKRICDPEHPGGIHIHQTEGKIVTELFRRYASGNATLSRLAAWLNESGLRTRNMHKMVDAAGQLASGPRLFTTASVRGILHNIFYTGKIVHRGQVMPGIHEPLVSEEVFNTVQAALKKNCGRSETLSSRPERHYLLKGIIRCAYCGMPMWAQTYQNGHTYYREHKASRSLDICPSAGGSIPCYIADEQVKKLVSAIELGPKWLDEVLAIISLKDEAERVEKQKRQVNEKLRRMGRAYIDGLIPDDEYSRQKRLLELELESLVIPGANAAEEAGNLLINLPKLWEQASPEEQRRLLLTMLDAVYLDAKKTNSIIAVKPKPPFRPVFQVAAQREKSVIHIINGSGDKSPNPALFLVEAGES
ncbi:recombinase family protein [Chloroflexota bacterium]